MMVLTAFISTLLSLSTLMFLDRKDKEMKLIIDKKELLLLGAVFLIVEMILFSYSGYGGEFVCHSLVFFYLVTAAFIDCKTQQVYRMGSILFIFVCILIFFARKMSFAMRLEKVVSLVMFHVALLCLGKMNFMGWGDVFTFMGVSYWLSAFTRRVLTLESCLYCLFISCLLFVISNLKKMDWKRLKLKEYQPFLPSLAAGALITIGFVR